MVMGLVKSLLMVGYGFAISDHVVSGVNFLSVLGTAVMAWVLAVESKTWLRRPHVVLVTLGTIGFVYAAYALSMAPLVVLVSTVIGTVNKIPQVRIALSGNPMWGLEPTALIVNGISWFTWTIYSMLISDWALIVSCGWGLLMHSVIMWKRLPFRRTLRSLANGRGGLALSRVARPLSAVFPPRPNTLWFPSVAPLGAVENSERLTV